MISEEKIAKLTSAVYKVTSLFPEKEPLKFAMRRESLDVLSSGITLISKSVLRQKNKGKSIKNALIAAKSLIHYFDLAEEQEWIDSKNFLVLKKEYLNLIFELEEQVLEFEFESRKIFNDKKFLLQNQAGNKDIAIGQNQEENQFFLKEKKEEIGSNKNIKNDITEEASAKLATETPKVNPVIFSTDETAKNDKKKEKDMMAIKSNVVIDYEELTSIQLKTLEILQNKGFLKVSQIGKYFEDASERSIRREIKELKDKSIIVAKGSGRSTFYELNYVY